MQELRMKQAYKESEPRRQADLMSDMAVTTFHRLNDFLMSLPKLAHVVLIGGLFILVFWIFKSMNKGHVEIVAQGNNAVNMTILLLVCLFLQMLWSAYNGDEGQGFGGM